MENERNLNLRQFVHDVNLVRRQNKNKWWTWRGVVNGESVTIKAYNTWVQRMDVDGMASSGPHECCVEDFKKFIRFRLGG